MPLKTEMHIRQTAQFKKAYKKLHANQRQALNKALETIIADPTAGEQKKGDLAWLRVYKCTIVNQRILVGYQIDAEQTVLIFVAIGSHENFYRDIKS